MSTVKVNELSTYSGTDISIETGKTVSGTASQFKMTDVVQGDVLYGSAADTLSRLAPGTSGEVLKTQGAGANPQWAAGGTNTPSFGAYRTADFDYTDDTWTLIPMDTEEWDTDSAFDHATYKFTVPADKAGKYSFSMTTTMTASSGTGQSMGTIRLAIYKGASGGSSSAFKQSWFDGSGGRQRWRCSTLTCVVDLIVGDFIEFYGYGESDTGNAVSIGGQSMTFCSGFKLI